MYTRRDLDFLEREKESFGDRKKENNENQYESLPCISWLFSTILAIHDQSLEFKKIGMDIWFNFKTKPQP